MNYKNTLLTIGILTFLPSHSALHHAAAAAGAGAGASRLIAPPGGLAIPNSENDKEKKEKIDKANAELEKFSSDSNWKKRKEIITKAVLEDEIHPDTLTSFGGSTPLYDVLFEIDKEKDLEFAQFLLNHGANPNRKQSYGGPCLENAKTVKMAQLLFDHGANQTVASHGAQLLKNAACSDQHEPELIEWFALHGVDPNQYHCGLTPLLEMVFLEGRYINRTAEQLKRVQLLIQVGALLQPTITPPTPTNQGYNVAQILKSKLDEAQKALQNNPETPEIARARIASCAPIRNILIAASNYRHDGLKEDLLKVLPVPQLCAIAAHYYIEPEPRYQELEAMPLPAPAQAARPMYIGRGFPLFGGLFKATH